MNLLPTQKLGLSNGILVLDVPEASAANKAGIQGTYRDRKGNILLGDIIIGIDGDEVKDEDDLFRAVEKHRVGDSVDIKLIRGADLDILTALSTSGDEDDDINKKAITQPPNVVTLKLTLSARDTVL